MAVVPYMLVWLGIDPVRNSYAKYFNLKSGNQVMYETWNLKKQLCAALTSVKAKVKRTSYRNVSKKNHQIITQHQSKDAILFQLCMRKCHSSNKSAAALCGFWSNSATNQKGAIKWVEQVQNRLTVHQHTTNRIAQNVFLKHKHPNVSMKRILVGLIGIKFHRGVSFSFIWSTLWSR